MAILTCSCEHKFQDKRYGKNRRVFNPQRDVKASNMWSCTICGKSRSGAGVVEKKEKKGKK